MSKKGNSLVIQTVFFGFVVIIVSLITWGISNDSIMSQDYDDYTDATGEDLSVTNTDSYFSDTPEFTGLPAWLLSVYGLLSLWGGALVIGWLRGTS